MPTSHKVAMLGTGLIGMFYTMALHGQRSRDEVAVVYSRQQSRADEFARQWGIAKATTDLKAAIQDPAIDTVVIGLPNFQHIECVELAAAAGKAILCTKPLGRNAKEAKHMLDVVEKAGVFHGYLEDLAYTPKTLKALASVRAGALGDVLWARSRETHPGPHSAWFWDKEQAGGGAIIDLGCHCAEIIRNYVGKENRPVEAMCWSDTLVHPIPAEDNAIALIKFESGAVGQFEVSWTFRGGMDLRDEVSGTQGTIWTNHFLRTGFEMFTAARGGYVAEKAESESGWLFPVGDEVHELGYTNMFTDMFAAMEERQGAHGVVLRRLRDQRHPRRLLQVRRVAQVGADRDRRLARRCPHAAHLHAAGHGRRPGRRQGRAHARQQAQADPLRPADRQDHRARHRHRLTLRAWLGPLHLA